MMSDIKRHLMSNPRLFAQDTNLIEEWARHNRQRAAYERSQLEARDHGVPSILGMGGSLALIVVHRYEPPQAGGRIWGPDNRQLTDREIGALAGLYVPPNEVAHAVAISRCESGHWTGAWATSGEDSRGPWQINIVPDAHPEWAAFNLFDPQICAYAMGQIFARDGWHPWSCAKTLGIV